VFYFHYVSLLIWLEFSLPEVAALKMRRDDHEDAVKYLAMHPGVMQWKYLSSPKQPVSKCKK